MPRIKPLRRDEAHPDAQPLFDQDMERFGMVLNPTGVMAYRPPILRAARSLARAVGVDGVLDAGLRAMICVRVATLVGCPF
jgi:hypothetical protein